MHFSSLETFFMLCVLCICYLAWDSWRGEKKQEPEFPPIHDDSEAR